MIPKVIDSAFNLVISGDEIIIITMISRFKTPILLKISDLKNCISFFPKIINQLKAH